MRCACLLVLALAACTHGAEPIGNWRFGLGTVDGRPARIGTIVLAGQTVVADDAAPLRLVCSEAPGITVILAAGSAGRFAVATAADGGRELVLDLDRGAAQVDVRDRTPYAGVRVRGAAVDVRVAGTLFVVERTRRDADFVALIRGRVEVGLRPEVAQAARSATGIELLERQGVAADTAHGLGTPTAMAARPQIALAAALRASVADQAAGTSDQGSGDWLLDLARELTGAGLEGLAAVGAGAAGTPEGPGGAAGFPALAEDLVDSYGEFGSLPTPVVDTVTAGVQPGGSSALPAPPSPPALP